MIEAGTSSEKLGTPKKELAVVIMGSPVDQAYGAQIAEALNGFGAEAKLRFGSAHKTPEHVLDIIEHYDSLDDISVVYIAVAGRSNALGGFIDAGTTRPVISAPPYSEKYGGSDIMSSIRMPSGMAVTVASEAEIAALQTVKIFALNNPELANKYSQFQQRNAEKVIKADKEEVNS